MTATARPGIIDNPEVYEDVPGHVIPIPVREFDDLDSEATFQVIGGEGGCVIG